MMLNAVCDSIMEYKEFENVNMDLVEQLAYTIVYFNCVYCSRCHTWYDVPVGYDLAQCSRCSLVCSHRRCICLKCDLCAIRFCIRCFDDDDDTGDNVVDMDDDYANIIVCRDCVHLTHTE